MLMSPIIEYENLRRTNASLFGAYKAELSEFLDSGWFILGDGVVNFEQQYANYCQTEYCAGVASGLDALTLAIDACDFPAGSEVIVPSNTYIATIMAVVRNGLIPILVEPDINTYNIDPSKIVTAITAKTKAILVVHLYGKVCDMVRIQNLADHYQLTIIEDVAQAQGAKHQGQVAGSFGIGCHSFYPTKNLGALGDGGAVTCHDELFVEKIKQLRNYGSNKKYHNELLGYNSRLDELQARFLSKKLNILDEINAHKQRLAQVYFEVLSDEFIKPQVDEDYYDVFHIFTIRHKKRDAIKDYLLGQGIKTEIHYPVAPHKQKAMQGLVKGNYPLSEEIHATTLSLPIAFFHTEEDVQRVAETLNGWLK